MIDQMVSSYIKVLILLFSGIVIWMFVIIFKVKYTVQNNLKLDVVGKTETVLCIILTLMSFIIRVM